MGVEGNGTSSEDADWLRPRHFAGINGPSNRIAAKLFNHKSDNLIFSEVCHGNSE
jgi:hypothetical protein